MIYQKTVDLLDLAIWMQSGTEGVTLMISLINVKSLGAQQFE